MIECPVCQFKEQCGGMVQCSGCGDCFPQYLTLTENEKSYCWDCWILLPNEDDELEEQS